MWHVSFNEVTIDAASTGRDAALAAQVTRFTRRIARDRAQDSVEIRVSDQMAFAEELVPVRDEELQERARP